MLGKMTLTLFIVWTLIMLWRFFKWATTPEEYGPPNRRFAIVCHSCGAMEETDDQFGIDNTPGRWDKFTCTRCKKGGKDAGGRIGSPNRANGT